MRYRRIALVAIVASCIGCDQAAKRVAVDELTGRERISLLGDTVRVELTENTGAFLGLGADWPPAVRFWVLVVATSVFLAFMAHHLFRLGAGQRLHALGAALVLGGGLGNLIDRVAHDGRVVDFLNVGVGSLRTGIFNVADMAITGGVALWMVALFRERSTGSDEPAPTPPGR